MTKCGIDIIEITRIEEAVKKNNSFLEKVFSEEEIAYFINKGNSFESLAGFFAAKEAFAKYMGTGISGFKLSEISVGHNELGSPYLSFKGVRQTASVSISHNKTTAVAVVCENTTESIANPLKNEMKSLLPKRPEHCHKGDFGKVLVIAGSRGMTGAAVLSAYSALRTGAGLVTLATAETERAIAASFYPEIMTKGLASKNGIICAEAAREILDLAKDKTAIVFGPGLGQNREITLVLEELLKSYSGSMVIDADGLNALSKNPDMLKEKKCSVVLTPHPGEMSRLTGRTVDEIQKNRQGFAEEISKKYGVCLVLKGHDTVVADGAGLSFVNPTGNSGMAKAGSGDVLSGVIAAFLAQGLKAFEAAKLGVYTHGLAGDIAKISRGLYGILATDIADAASQAIMEILK